MKVSIPWFVPDPQIDGKGSKKRGDGGALEEAFGCG